MKKIFLLIFSLFIFQNFYGQEKWDDKNNSYVNHDLNFAWDLGTNPDWERVMEISKKTVFKAKCIEAPVIVFVMPNEYNSKLENIDIWDKYKDFQQSEDITHNKFLEIGVNQKTISIKKVSFAGKHAIKVINKIEGVDKEDLSIEKSTKISIRTIHNGRMYSICITLLTDFYDELLSQGFNIESLYKGFVFLYDHKLDITYSSISSKSKQNCNKSSTISESDCSLLTNKLIELCKQLNRQTPITVDEITKLYSIAYYNKSLKFFYKVDLSLDDFSNEDLKNMKIVMKQTQKQLANNMLSIENSNSSSNYVYEIMKTLNLNLCFVYRDTNDKLMFETRLTCEDFK